jgi:DNA polymerase
VKSISLQITESDEELKKLQKKHGHRDVYPINGAGCIEQPELLLLFMNPTARNVSADPKWTGIRAPWLGTKNIWKMLKRLNLIEREQFEETQKLKPGEWTVDFSENLYRKLAGNKVYITNLAKCTQKDAKPLKNKIFREYLELARKEILAVNPKIIVSFGIQVSEILLEKKIELKSNGEEKIMIGNKSFRVFPTYYPVGQGMRNMEKAVERIRQLRENKDTRGF